MKTPDRNPVRFDSESCFNVCAAGRVDRRTDEWSPSLTLRGGFVTLDQPIPASQTLFNILAPGSGSIPPGFGGGEANLRMDQNALGVAFGWRY